ncbi:MAG: ORF6N domain-containing protein [Campylobacterales bacterium]|nr:ORF6N domain-containing protein [Campylobacterales bacterium]
MADLIKKDIEDKIFTIRGVQVMLDRDLAELYGVNTKVLNQAVKRNIERFPIEFRFQLSETEKDGLVTNCDRLQLLKHSSFPPFVFTEQGVSMLSAVLRSETAIKTSIHIINGFVKMRNFLSSNADIFKRLDLVEKRQITHEIKTDEKFEKLFDALEDKSLKPKQGIFFDGQIFDAYLFVSGLVKKAKNSIILIDNYCDETTLSILGKCEPNVKVKILTKSITKELRVDLQKHNTQYAKIEAKEFTSSHDRFLIIDEVEIYHIGASLKDLGKKWFAFSLLEVESFGLMGRVKKAMG